MVLKMYRLHVAAVLPTILGAVYGQNDSAAGPPWIQSQYSTSPPVYPSRKCVETASLRDTNGKFPANATGIGWEAAYQQATNFVNQLTIEEKAQLVTGTIGPCVGNIGPIKRLGFNGLCLMDGPLAIRQADYASVFPAGITVAASWDRNFAHMRGHDMAMEFKEKGANVILGPVAGPLGRSGYGGRNWEGFSPDPYLTGDLFAMVRSAVCLDRLHGWLTINQTIEGIQETGLQACAKRE